MTENHNHSNNHNHVHDISENNENKTLLVIVFTLFTMFFEVTYGYITHSMALLADGYHMGTHVLALGLTYIAYVLARNFKNSALFPNGTDKIGTLAGYTSALFLVGTGAFIIIEAVERFINPLQINFNDAIIVAIIGLIVNLVCIFIMEGKKLFHNLQEHSETDKKDYNFKAAYFHILADALTSLLAIFALLVGKYLNVIYLDSLIGILGGILILRWSFELLKDTVKILLDIK